MTELSTIIFGSITEQRKYIYCEKECSKYFLKLNEINYGICDNFLIRAKCRDSFRVTPIYEKSASHT